MTNESMKKQIIEVCKNQALRHAVLGNADSSCIGHYAEIEAVRKWSAKARAASSHARITASLCYRPV